jgi:hypothetical protein
MPQFILPLVQIFLVLLGTKCSSLISEPDCQMRQTTIVLLTALRAVMFSRVPSVAYCTGQFWYRAVGGSVLSHCSIEQGTFCTCTALPSRMENAQPYTGTGRRKGTIERWVKGNKTGNICIT